MSSRSTRPPSGVLTEGARRSHRRRRTRTRRRRSPRLALWVAGALIAVVAVSGLIDELTSQDSTTAERGVDHGAASAQGRRAEHQQERQAGAATAPAPTHVTASDHERFGVDLSTTDVVHLRFKHRPRAGLLFDLRTGRPLWRHNPTRRLPVASLTKMMTALVVVEKGDPHDRVRITRRAVRTGGSGVGVLPKGKKVQLEALLNGLLLVSGNDAAVALAQHTAGTVAGFVRLMNLRARELGLPCTRFTTPHGLIDAGNHSCAVDLATLARADFAHRRIRRVAGRRRAIVKFPIKGGRLFLYNNNPLMRSGYRGVTGLKTGYTERAGRSIVATAKRGKVQLGVVLLHSENPTEQAAKLLDRGFKAERRLRAAG
jgi:serine-type D-Ala-D-Ala carboxypeptidase (penicillin-binding protein 5/6)